MRIEKPSRRIQPPEEKEECANFFNFDAGCSWSLCKIPEDQGPENFDPQMSPQLSPQLSSQLSPESIEKELDNIERILILEEEQGAEINAVQGQTRIRVAMDSGAVRHVTHPALYPLALS